MSDRTERAAAQEAPGGGNSRGPEYNTVGDVQADVPPYDELRGEPSAESAEGVAKSFDASNAPQPGPAPTETEEERDGVSGTELDPEPALGVGKSTSKGAEEQAPDRDDVDTKGPSQRPVGRAEPDEDRLAQDPQSPDLQPGGG